MPGQKVCGRIVFDGIQLDQRGFGPDLCGPLCPLGAGDRPTRDFGSSIGATLLHEHR